jgi:hypothetical protein
MNVLESDGDDNEAKRQDANSWLDLDNEKSRELPVIR